MGGLRPAQSHPRCSTVTVRPATASCYSMWQCNCLSVLKGLTAKYCVNKNSGLDRPDDFLHVFEPVFGAISVNRPEYNFCELDKPKDNKKLSCR